MRRAISSAMRCLTTWRPRPFSGEGLSTRIPRQSTWSEGYSSQALAASSSLPHGDGEVSGFYRPLFRGESQLMRSKAEKTLRFAVISRRNYRVFVKLILNLFVRVPVTLSLRFYFVPSPRDSIWNLRGINRFWNLSAVDFDLFYADSDSFDRYIVFLNGYFFSIFRW